MNQELLEKLTAPLNIQEIEWKVQSAKKGLLVVPYIDARTVYNRLANVFGLGNYSLNHEPVIVNGKIAYFKATISIKVDGEWCHFSDGSEASDIEPVKGGISGAYKRTIVLMGVGHDLYKYPKVTIETDSKYIGFREMPILNAITYSLQNGYTFPGTSEKGKHTMADALYLIPDGKDMKVATQFTKRNGGMEFNKLDMRDMSKFKLFTTWQK